MAVARSSGGQRPPSGASRQYRSRRAVCCLFSIPIFANDLSFKQRFKSLIDQYELRELHFHSLLRSKELEVQFNMARYDAQRKSAEAEVNRSRALNAQVLTFSKTETELRNQLNIYVEKFKQVRSSVGSYLFIFIFFIVSIYFISIYISQTNSPPGGGHA